MTTRIPLPRYETLPEGVYFHRRFEHDVRVFILQVPDVDRLDSETHIVDLGKTMHSAWMEGLKNSRSLLTALGWAPHVAYCPKTGHFEEMAELDAVSPVAEKIALARKEASYSRSEDRLLNRRHRRQEANRWGPSKLRVALGGRVRRRFQ
jgi:hypothetical protein